MKAEVDISTTLKFQKGCFCDENGYLEHIKTYKHLSDTLCVLKKTIDALEVLVTNK